MERILDRVTVGDSQCYLWSGPVTKYGYGQSGGNRKKYGTSRAHRIAWIQECGTIPDGMSVLHRCDNRLCCNPEHLFLGTHQDNMSDMKSKGRGGVRSKPVNQGSSNPMARLTPDQVQAIRLDARHWSEVSEAFGISRRMVYNIQSGKSWSSI